MNRMFDLMQRFRALFPLSLGTLAVFGVAVAIMKLSWALPGQAAHGSMSAPAILQSDRFSRVLDSVVALGVPGIQAHVNVAGRSWTRAAGMASVERQVAMTTRHRLRLASVTKMMTYASTTELARRGRLSLADRPVTLLPAGVLRGIPYADDITVEQLLEHTSGLHNYNGESGAAFVQSLFGDTSRGTRRWPPEELVAFARDPGHPPTGRPGERRSYSNTGYSVLEMTITAREHKTLSQLFANWYSRHSA